MTAAVARERIRLPLLAVVFAAVGLIAARMVWPKLLFDTTSLILFGIAALAWALAYVPVTKLKWGDFEAELEPLVAALGQKVIAAEAAPSAGRMEPRPDIVYRGGVDLEEAEHPAANEALAEFQEIVGSVTADREKLARVAELIDRVAGQGRFDAATTAAVDELSNLQRLIRGGMVLAKPAAIVLVLDYAGRLLRKMTT